MKGSKKPGRIFTVFLLAGVLFCSSAFAASLEQPPGDPPFGLKIEGAAGGTKLYGVIALQLYEVDSSGIGKARAVLRVRKGNEITVFFADQYTTTEFHPTTFTCTDITNFLPIEVDVNNPLQVQLAVTCAMKNQILDTLFLGDRTLQIHLKTITDFINITVGPPNVIYTDPSIWDLADVELAVN